MKKSVLIGGTAAAAVLALALGAAYADARGGDGGRMGGMMGGDGPRMEIAQFDADGDGKVTAEEIDGFRAARFAEIDANGDGSISKQEFTDHAAARAGERAGEMFDRLDADSDGVLSQDAIAATMGRGPDGARLIARFDTDGDGAISQDEIQTAMAEMREHRGEGRFGNGGKGRFGGGMMGQGNN